MQDAVARILLAPLSRLALPGCSAQAPEDPQPCFVEQFCLTCLINGGIARYGTGWTCRWIAGQPQHPDYGCAERTGGNARRQLERPNPKVRAAEQMRLSNEEPGKVGIRSGQSRCWPGECQVNCFGQQNHCISFRHHGGVDALAARPMGAVSHDHQHLNM